MPSVKRKTFIYTTSLTITSLYSRVDQNELELTENKAAITVNADHITDLETESKIFNFQDLNIVIYLS